MKQLIIDHISFIDPSNLIVEVRGNRLPRLIGKLQSADTKNGNGRVYPRETLLREVNKYIEGPIKQNTSTGELDHPDSSIISLSNVSHIIKRIWWEGEDVMGEIELLNTPSGKIAQEIVAAGIPLGISSRGMGSVKQLGETVEVQDDFELLCWDLVSIPSTPGAYMRLQEGLNKNQNKYEKVNKTITDILCNMHGICPLC
jgi:hypothetical protein